MLLGEGKRKGCWPGRLEPALEGPWTPGCGVGTDRENNGQQVELPGRGGDAGRLTLQWVEHGARQWGDQAAGSEECRGKV